MDKTKLCEHAEQINELLARYGVKFGIYKDNKFREQLFPFDAIPRVISKADFEILEKGLKQRVKALNCFIRDIYSDKKILADGVIPEDMIYTSVGYLTQCNGVVPPKGIYTHIAGIDLVQAKSGEWYVLEDNLRVPSGAAYPLIARNLCKKCSPSTFAENDIEDNRDYSELLKKTMDFVNTGGKNVILTPGRFNAAYFEHSYLAEQTGAQLVCGKDLVVENDHLYFIDCFGKKEMIGCVYRRISDEYLDPMNFNEESVIGISHIFDVYRKGNVALINAPGNGIADDKALYYYVPQMIQYYLKEEPVLKNAPTYLPVNADDQKYIMENFDRLVLKDVTESGGYGTVFANKMTDAEKEAYKNKIKADPRRYIAQDIIDFTDMEIMEGEGTSARKADYRAFVLTAKDNIVWKGGLTRFSGNPDSLIVNSSQGGGFKDTWVLSR